MAGSLHRLTFLICHVSFLGNWLKSGLDLTYPEFCKDFFAFNKDDALLGLSSKALDLNTDVILAQVISPDVASSLSCAVDYVSYILASNKNLDLIPT
jgi:hypothetical protein